MAYYTPEKQSADTAALPCNLCKQLVDERIGIGLPEALSELIAGSDIDASKGGLEDNGRQLSTLISRLTPPWHQTV